MSFPPPVGSVQVPPFPFPLPKSPAPVSAVISLSWCLVHYITFLPQTCPTSLFQVSQVLDSPAQLSVPPSLNPCP